MNPRTQNPRPVHLWTSAPARLTAGTLLAAALLAACGEADPAGSTSDAVTGPTETDQPVPRVLVASDEQVTVLDADSLDTVETFDVDARPILSVAGDGRHVYTLESDADRIGVIDAGSWTEAHGEHGHSFTADPARLDSVVEGPTAYHAVSDDERTVVWFDGDGSFVTFDHGGLEGDRIGERRIETGAPHHGVAVPTAEGGFLASIAVGDAPVGLALLDETGAETTRFETCEGLHGETHVGETGYAFGCADGIIVVADGSATNIAAPLPGAGTGSLVEVHDSSVVVGSLYSETDDSASTSLALYDTAAGTATLVDLGVEFSNLASVDGHAVVLGTDGALHLVDVATGEVTSIDVMDGWDKPESFRDPRPVLAAAGDRAWITDPGAGTLALVDLESGETVQRTELDATPTSLTVVNAATHAH
ncbi:hypothetical protein [Aeromicrobium marinum]|nr:hypothetical protein [Aeromicrobium marinum]